MSLTQYDRDLIYSFLWNNPFNLYSFTQEPTKESIAMQVAWQAPPILGYAAAVGVGAEVAGLAGWYSVPSMLGVPFIGTAYVFGAVTAAAMVYDVHTNPQTQQALQTGLKNPGSNRDIMGMMSLGSVV